jgi:hypothetical protein
MPIVIDAIYHKHGRAHGWLHTTTTPPLASAPAPGDIWCFSLDTTQCLGHRHTIQHLRMRRTAGLLPARDPAAFMAQPKGAPMRCPRYE